MNTAYLTNIIIKSIKIWVAGIGAILFAEFLGLDFSVSAGIVAILSVAQTKKETLKTIVNRFYAFAIALLISYAAYNLIGFTILAFAVYLILFVLVCNVMKWENAIAMNSVLISHFLTFKSMEINFIINEVLLFIIGATLAIIVNLHLRQNIYYMAMLKNATDEQIKIVLERMSQKIATNEIKDYNGDCFEKLNNHILVAKKTAEENYMNQFLNAEKWDIEYILMRERQINVLYIIYTYILKIKNVTATTNDISVYLKKISMKFSTDNSAEELLEELHELMNDLKATKLPKTREEFEDRALLYLIMNHIEEFLLLKSNFYRKLREQKNGYYTI